MWTWRHELFFENWKTLPTRSRLFSWNKHFSWRQQNQECEGVNVMKIEIRCSTGASMAEPTTMCNKTKVYWSQLMQFCRVCSNYSTDGKKFTGRHTRLCNGCTFPAQKTVSFENVLDGVCRSCYYHYHFSLQLQHCKLYGNLAMNFVMEQTDISAFVDVMESSKSSKLLKNIRAKFSTS